MRPHERALALTLLALSTTVGCSRGSLASEAQEVRAERGSSAPDLLDLAFDAASAIPLEPHVKTRSKSQERVALTALELGRIERAIEFADGIADWRRGTALASSAFARVERGESAGVDELLERATEIALDAAAADEQAWRVDRIRAGVARTLYLLGRDEEAGELQIGIGTAEMIAVDEVRARLASAEAVQSRLTHVDAIIEQGDFDAQRSVLASCAALHERFYEDPERRTALEAKIESSFGKLPIDVRLELLERLVESALGQGDGAHALDLLERARAVAGSVTWRPGDRIEIDARHAAFRFRSGEQAEGRSDLDAALASYELARPRIVDIDRVEALVPLAEAFASMGDAATAESVYARAIEEAVVNPNSRPRAEDLVLVLCSMAADGYEPSAALRERLAALVAALDHPW